MIYLITEITGKGEGRDTRLIAASNDLQVAEAHKATLEASFVALPAAAAQVKASFDTWIERNPPPARPERPNTSARPTPQERAAARGDANQTLEQRRAARAAEQLAAKQAAKEAVDARKTWARRAQNRVNTLCDNRGIERLDWQTLAGATTRIKNRRYIIKEVPEIT